MENQKLYGRQCEPALVKVRQILHDPQIGEDCEMLKHYQEIVRQKITFAVKHQYLTTKQVNSLEKMYSTYLAIVKMNQSFETGFRESAADLLEEVATASEPYWQGDSSLRMAGATVRSRARHFRDGKYYCWDVHVLSTQNFLRRIREKGVEVGTLEEKINALVERVSLPDLWQ